VNTFINDPLYKVNISDKKPLNVLKHPSSYFISKFISNGKKEAILKMYALIIQRLHLTENVNYTYVNKLLNNRLHNCLLPYKTLLKFNNNIRVFTKLLYYNNQNLNKFNFKDAFLSIEDTS
jgi:hypothetical protein